MDGQVIIVYSQNWVWIIQKLQNELWIMVNQVCLVRKYEKVFSYEKWWR